MRERSLLPPTNKENRSSMRRNFSTFVFALAVMVFVPSATAMTSPTQDAVVAKVSQWLESSGFPHRKTGDTSWVVERPSGKKGWVLVATGSDFVVVAVIVAEKNNIRVTSDLNFNLLKLNHSMDYFKVGYDDDDDLFVRIEAKIRTVDAVSLKEMISQIDAAADKTYETVRPFLATP